MNWIYRKIKRSIPKLLIMTGCGLLSAYLGVAFALQSRKVIDFATAGAAEDAIRACILLLVNVLCSGGASLLEQHLRELLQADMDCSLKRDVIHSVLYADFGSITKYHSGELVNRLNVDVRTFVTGLVSIIPQTIILVFRIVFSAIVLSRMAGWLSICLMGATFIIVCAIFVIKRRMTRLNKNVSEAAGKVGGTLQEITEKLLAIKGLNVEVEVEKRADAGLEIYRTNQLKRKNTNLVMSAGMHLISAAVTVGALAWSSILLLNGQITFGGLTAVTSLASQVSYPIISMPSMIPQLMAIIASGERLTEILQVRQEKRKAKQRKVELDARKGFEGIRFSNVSFAYETERDLVLDDVSFEIGKGGLAAVVGSSGVGKSTILKLILGIYQPLRGEVTIKTNGESQRASEETRRYFAYAPQGNLLMSGTIRDNILLANPSATEDELKEALYAGCMDECVSSLPNGMDTYLGENGGGLSEGQIQRLSLVRAVISGAPVLLLDEITSALDAETEQTVLKRIAEMNRTCIVVTHRMGVLDFATEKLIVEKNRVIRSMNNPDSIPTTRH